ncbi:hypothetical protein [Brasilonema sp. UFV-L1]|uniref:hypothetical protein n=1 Tax=Brasilonema sp. UFV-L1 TaxID=2234130 RepID=UPI00145D1C95|nr:hypothetical protein [Brasilonema sp. UFV-L1]
MSVVKFEQETLAVVTELADEEIYGIVGGYGTDVNNKTKVGVEAKGENVQVSTQVGQATVIGKGDAKVYQSSNQEIDKSKDSAYINYGSF